MDTAAPAALPGRSSVKGPTQNICASRSVAMSTFMPDSAGNMLGHQHAAGVRHRGDLQAEPAGPGPNRPIMAWVGPAAG
jgi:hypothetical protein